MAGKASVFASGGLFYAMDKISKNTLIDMVLDAAHRELGEEIADERIARHVQQSLDTVARMRGDKPANLLSVLTRWENQKQVYLERQSVTA